MSQMDRLPRHMVPGEQGVELLQAGQRVQRELEAPWRPFHTYTTIIGREDYDPINSFWAPLCMEDLMVV